MKKLTIIRLEGSDEGALGTLLMDGLMFCTTLEPDVNDTKRFQIPVGEYICKRFHGTKWSDTFEVIVPDHFAVLFHSGNIEEHTEGCILLGRQPGYLRGSRAVLNSGHTFREFMSQLKDVDEFKLTIYVFRRDIPSLMKRPRAVEESEDFVWV